MPGRLPTCLCASAPCLMVDCVSAIPASVGLLVEEGRVAVGCLGARRLGMCRPSHRFPLPASFGMKQIPGLPNVSPSTRTYFPFHAFQA